MAAIVMEGGQHRGNAADEVLKRDSEPNRAAEGPSGEMSLRQAEEGGPDSISGKRPKCKQQAASAASIEGWQRREP
jgi:hypothetical protein